MPPTLEGLWGIVYSGARLAPGRCVVEGRRGDIVLEDRSSRMKVGAAVWMGALLALSQTGPARSLPTQVSRLWRYAVSGPLEVVVLCPPAVTELRPGDPVFEEVPGGGLQQVGRVVSWRAVGDLGSGETRVAIDSTHRQRLGVSSRFAVGESSGTPGWILRTLVPEAKRRELVAELDGFLSESRETLLAVATVMSDALFAEVRIHLEGNLASALETHESALADALKKHGGVWDDQVLPVLGKALWPYARERTSPLLTTCVERIWEELPLTSTMWGALKSRVKESVGFEEIDTAWRQELVEIMVQVLEEHADEFQEAFGDVARFAASDPAIRGAVGQLAAEAFGDPAVQEVLKTILRDAVARPFDIRGFLSGLLDDPTVRGHLEDLERRLEPHLLRVARLLTVSDSGTEIDADLARVLRRVVFGKDRRFVVVRLVAAERQVPAGHAFRAISADDLEPFAEAASSAGEAGQ